MDLSGLRNFRIPWPWILVVAFLIFLAFAVWGLMYDYGEQKYGPVLPTVVLASPTAFGTPMATATLTPTVTPTPMVPGDIYTVTSIEKDGIFIYGRNRDKAVFTNVNVPTVTITAHCSIPTWPSPELEHKYVLNSYGVLVPIEGIYSPLQRFWVIP